MSDQTPDHILARAQNPTVNGRPIRKDEIELTARGLYIESWLPERRSRRRPLLFVHGELGGSWVWERYLGFFAGRGWEGHALNLRNHHLSQTADPADLSFESFVEDVRAAMVRLGDGVVTIGHGMGALLALKAAERHAAGGLVLVAPELPGDLRRPTPPHAIREIPELFGRSVLGWETLPEKLLREHRDLALADVLRIQHLMGQKPHESGRARRAMLRGIRVDRSLLGEVPTLVVSAGLDRSGGVADGERLATWLGAEHQPFAAHSAYGLVLAEDGHAQAAETIRVFLELHRL